MRHKEVLAYPRVALVLQGGGALGSYQAGVIEGLYEVGISPNWVAGISIGALNCALMAGNAPKHRVGKLKEFWETICRPPSLAATAVSTMFDMFGPGAQALRTYTQNQTERMLGCRRGVSGGRIHRHNTFFGRSL